MMKRLLAWLLVMMLCLSCAAAETFTVEMSLEEIVYLGAMYKADAEDAVRHDPEEPGTVEAACDYYGDLAAKWLTMAAEAGNTWSMAALGELYLDPLYQPVDRELGMAWLTKAAEAGNVHAMTLLGQQYPFTEERRLLLEQAAEAGDAEAMVYLAAMYQMGLGDIEDPDQEAERCYLLALEAGREDVLTELCVLYQITDQDEKAKAVCMKYALAGNVEAMMQLADLHIQGPLIEVPQEKLDTAVHWYIQAAENGSVDAMHTLGQLYGSPYSALQDKEEACFWLRCAALHGHEDASRLLAVIREEGQ